MATAVAVRSRETFNGILAAAKANLSEVTRNACMHDVAESRPTHDVAESRP